MKILWVVGTPRKIIREILHMPLSFNVSGGWIDDAYKQISSCPDVSIDFVCADRSVKKGEILSGQKDNSKAFCIHLGKISFGKKGNQKTIDLLKQIIQESKPDIIQIWGSESGLAYDIAMANVDKIPTVIFVQGLIGIHSLYFIGNYKQLSNEKLGFFGFKSMLMSKIKQKYYKKQIEMEKVIAENSVGILSDNIYTENYFKNYKNTIKRFNYVLPVNANIQNAEWSINSCSHNTIFTIFGTDMNKGLFQLVKAVKIVKKTIPDVKLMLPGPYALQANPKARDKKLSLFEIWLKRYIKKNDLKNNIEFVGYQTPSQMAEQLKKANLFVNPSCMEVHANSLREAMHVGVPCISSVCGCVLEFVKHGENGLLYRYDEASVLASEILTILNDDKLATKLGANGRVSINEKYDQSTSLQLIDVYNEILNKKIS